MILLLALCAPMMGFLALRFSVLENLNKTYDWLAFNVSVLVLCAVSWLWVSLDSTANIVRVELDLGV